MPSWSLRHLDCDVNAFVSPVTRSEQIKQVWADARIIKDKYSEINYIAYSILNTRPLNLVLIENNQNLHYRSQYWNDNKAALANGGFVHKANWYPCITRAVYLYWLWYNDTIRSFTRYRESS